MPHWKTLVRRTLLDSLIVYLSLSVIAGIALAELQLHPQRHPVAKNVGTVERAILGGDPENVEVRAADGVLLKAWYIRPRKADVGDVLMLHGVADNREGVAGFAPMFLEHGYGVLMPDSRAHGESGGKIATYGLLERNDIHRWVSWLYSTQHSRCVYGFGESMGAAQVLESLHAESRFCAVVAESPFSSFRAVGCERAAFYVGAPPWVGRTVLRLPVEIGILYARIRYGLDFARDNPIQAVAESSTPVLLIHGTRDINILPRHSELIAARSPSHVVLWEVPGATHCGASSVQPVLFWRKVLGWYATHSHEPLTTGSSA